MRTVQDTLESRLADVRRRIAGACARSGRRPDDVTLVAATKTVSAETLRAAWRLGLHQFGENRVQEALGKQAQLQDCPADWAMIGHLQTNKAAAVAGFADSFHALDSVRAAEALQRALKRVDRRMDVFVQVNTSGEHSKYGVSPGDAAALLSGLQPLNRLRVRGLMTLAVFSDDPDHVRACFRRLAQTRADLRERWSDVRDLSMGMSGDFETAIEEGADGSPDRPGDLRPAGDAGQRLLAPRGRVTVQATTAGRRRTVDLPADPIPRPKRGGEFASEELHEGGDAHRARAAAGRDQMQGNGRKRPVGHEGFEPTFRHIAPVDEVGLGRDAEPRAEGRRQRVGVIGPQRSGRPDHDLLAPRMDQSPGLGGRQIGVAEAGVADQIVRVLRSSPLREIVRTRHEMPPDGPQPARRERGIGQGRDPQGAIEAAADEVDDLVREVKVHRDIRMGR